MWNLSDQLQLHVICCRTHRFPMHHHDHVMEMYRVVHRVQHKALALLLVLGRGLGCYWLNTRRWRSYLCLAVALVAIGVWALCDFILDVRCASVCATMKHVFIIATIHWAITMSSSLSLLMRLINTVFHGPYQCRCSCFVSILYAFFLDTRDMPPRRCLGPAPFRCPAPCHSRQPHQTGGWL